MAKNTQQAIKDFRDYFVPLAGTIMVLLNLWLASKLAPLVQDIRALDIRVAHVEASVDKCDQGYILLRDKLDQLLELLYERTE